MHVTRRRFAALVYGLLSECSYADGDYGMRMATLVGEVEFGCFSRQALQEIVSSRFKPGKGESDKYLKIGYAERVSLSVGVWWDSLFHAPGRPFCEEHRSGHDMVGAEHETHGLYL